jgi:hypothetical protein
LNFTPALPITRCFHSPLPTGALPRCHPLSSKSGSYHVSRPAGRATSRKRFFSVSGIRSDSFCGSKDVYRQTRSTGPGLPIGSHPGPGSSGHTTAPSSPIRYAASSCRRISSFLFISEAISWSQNGAVSTAATAPWNSGIFATAAMAGRRLAIRPLAWSPSTPITPMTKGSFGALELLAYVADEVGHQFSL